MRGGGLVKQALVSRHNLFVPVELQERISVIYAWLDSAVYSGLLYNKIETEEGIKFERAKISVIPANTPFIINSNIMAFNDDVNKDNTIPSGEYVFRPTTYKSSEIPKYVCAENNIFSLTTNKTIAVTEDITVKEFINKYYHGTELSDTRKLVYLKDSINNFNSETDSYGEDNIIPRGSIAIIMDERASQTHPMIIEETTNTLTSEILEDNTNIEFDNK